MRVLYAELAGIAHDLPPSTNPQVPVESPPKPKCSMDLETSVSPSSYDDTRRSSLRFDALFAHATWPGREGLQSKFRCDRRQTARWVVPGRATILALGTELGNVSELTRLDGSPWWLAGDARESIAPGTRVSVGFSEPEGRPACGFVERCEGFGDGRFRVAIRFDGASVA